MGRNFSKFKPTIDQPTLIHYRINFRSDARCQPTMKNAESSISCRCCRNNNYNQRIKGYAMFKEVLFFQYVNWTQTDVFIVYLLAYTH